MKQATKKKKCPHWVDIYVGKKLRQRRLFLKLSQARLGKSIAKPVTFQQMQKYENGLNRISISNLWDMATSLETPVLDFFPDMEALPETNPPPEPGYLQLCESPEPFISAAEERKFIEQFNRLTSKRRKAVAAFIRSLARADDGI